VADIETIVRVEGRAGRITLNRPRALNALRFEQIAVIRGALEQWRDDDAVKLVILDGAGDRGLCAGGDVRELYHARETDPDFAARFWRDEYHLNAMIHRYPKPIVALMDGIVMGGGIGLSAHASHRIVTETSQIAMPETSIGLVPDVGGTWLLANAPGRLGTFVGLTGTRMAAADAIYAGFADTHVKRADIDALIAELIDVSGEPVGVTVAEYASAPGPAVLANQQSDMDHLCDARSAADIQVRLTAPDAPDWAQAAGRSLEDRSPLALALFLEAVRRAADAADLEAALATEYRLVTRLDDQGEFPEGVRALIIDKDRAPKWQYAALDDVPDQTIADFFAPLADRAELWA